LNVNCQSIYGQTFYNTDSTGKLNGPLDGWVSDVFISPNAANTGSAYLGYSTLTRSSGVGVIAVIKKGDPTFRLSDQMGANKIRFGDLYIDFDNSSDFIIACAYAWG
jgi:hypothetical protein